jgi:predicted HTH transcriptional regulator
MFDAETNRIEYKSQLADGFEREVVAFLNYREGGQIYIGVNKSGNTVGVEHVDSLQLRIVDRIKNNISPNTLGLFDVIAEKHDGKDIIKIVISSGTEKPYYIKSKGMSETGCYIRVGSSAQPMTTKMIHELFMKRNHLSLGHVASPRKKLTFEQLKIYYSEKHLTLNDEFLNSLDLLTIDGNYNYAAYLLADENGISIKVAKYFGTDKVDLVENEEYGYCCLVTAANRVLEKLHVENKTFAKITPKTRLEKNMIDKTALREAFINAIVHNDYTRGVPPVVEIFSDRLTITSYGGLPHGLSQENFFNCRSMPRNRELMRVFKDIGLVEHLGSGMGRILKVYDKSIFKFEDNFLIVTFPFEESFSDANSSFGNDGNKNGNNLGNDLNKNNL